MDQQKTGAYLKALRKERGLTQEQLAEHFFVSSRTVSRWETGRTVPDVETLLALADFFGVDVREIIAGEQAAVAADRLEAVARYAAEKERGVRSGTVYGALGIFFTLWLCTVLFAGESKGLLYGYLPESICSGILFLVYGAAIALTVAYLRACLWQETPARKPAKSVMATVISKEVISGTHGAGRSKGGYSYLVNFLTEDRQSLALFAYELEFGALKEGATGLLRYEDRYFVSFSIIPAHKETDL